VGVVIHATSVQSTGIASLPQAGSALLVIFGASGDLTRRKLIPALYVRIAGVERLAKFSFWPIVENDSALRVIAGQARGLPSIEFVPSPCEAIEKR